MATHSSTLAQIIPWMEEPGRLQSMGSLRVGHDGATSLSLFSFMLWRRKWQPTAVFWPGESQGPGSLVGCHLWGGTESDMTEATQQTQQLVSLDTNQSHLYPKTYYPASSGLQDPSVLHGEKGNSVSSEKCFSDTACRKSVDSNSGAFHLDLVAAYV